MEIAFSCPVYDENSFNESDSLKDYSSEEIINKFTQTCENHIDQIGKNEKFIVAMILAGVASHTLFHPFDTMKVRSQNNSEVIRQETKNNISENFSKILKDPKALKNILEAVCDETKSLYSGYRAAMSRTILKIAIGALAIEHIPHLLEEELRKTGYHSIPDAVLFPLSAFLVGLAEATLFCGFEKVKTHQMSTNEKVTAKSIVNQHGFKVLFRGFLPFLLKETAGKTFSSYANKFRKNNADNMKKHLPEGWFYPMFAIGQSFASTILLMPFDIFKTSAQKHDATKEAFCERLSNITQNGKEPLNLWKGGQYRFLAHIGINYLQALILDRFGLEKRKH